MIATHGHWDHLSGMACLREESDARLILRAEDVHGVEQGDPQRTAAFIYGKPFPPVKVDALLRDGDLLEIGGFRFTVYHTPGHTLGSVCLWTQTDGLSLLIAGDMLYGGYHPAFASNLDSWRQSLDRLLGLEFDAMAIGHGTPGLIFDAKHKVRQARERFGYILDPWYMLTPDHTTQ